MPRIKDVDTVAPDNEVLTPPISKPVKKTSTPIVTSTIPPIDDQHVTKTVYDIFGHTKHPFSSALIIPKVFSFTEKNDDETILLALRSHWFTNVPWIIVLIFMLYIPSLLRFVPSFSLAMNIKIIITFSWYLVAFAYAFEQFLSWYFDVYIVTNHRVVDIDFNNLLDKKFSEADLVRIQDVTSRVSGVSQTIFNYGTVLIQTAAEQNEIIFEKVPHPDKVVKVLQDLRHFVTRNDNGGLE